MGCTETEFMAGAERAGLAVLPSSPLPGLTTHGHLLRAEDTVVRATIVEALRWIFLELGGDEQLLAAKRRLPLRPDGYLDGQLLEVDEIQHFSSARLRTLEMYPAGTALGFDLDEYRELCRHWSSRGGDHYRAAKQTVDFPHHGGRTAQRAYFDAARDLLAEPLGAGPVIRVAAPGCDGTLALRRLEQSSTRS